MESLSERIKTFLDPGSGYGYGYGSGYGYGDGSGDGSGYGYGYGSGYGDGSGDGSGYGYGSGYGDGDGLKSYCGQAVHIIDGLQTLIDNVRGNVAKGKTLTSDLITHDCFIVKQDGCFAHGDTLADAMSALRDKLFEDMSEEERIAAFIAEHRLGQKYPCRDLYDWHHRLTGSCDMGRREFARDHGIDVDVETRTVEEFIELTRNAYGGEVIRHLEAAYKRTEPPKEEASNV